MNELAKIVGISQKGVEWQIAKLKKEDRIKRIGSDKGGHWDSDKMKSENANNTTLNHNNIPEEWKKVKLV